MGLLHFIFGNPEAESLKNEVALLRRDITVLRRDLAKTKDRLNAVNLERHADRVSRAKADKEFNDLEEEATALRARVNELERCLQSVGRLISVCKDPVKGSPEKATAPQAPAMPKVGERVVFGFNFQSRTAHGRAMAVWPASRQVKIRADDGLLFIRTFQPRGAAGNSNDWCEVVT